MQKLKNTIKDALSVAESISNDHEFCRDFSKVVEFLSLNPLYNVSMASYNLSEKENLKKLAEKMLKGRATKKLSPPKTSPDKMVEFIIKNYYNIQSADTIQMILNSHNQAMSAENIIGTMLEAYIASEASTFGWIWCSGSVVKSIDFLYQNDENTNDWKMLQIKNRSNSENSSSSSVRDGTKIIKWYRSNANTGACMWDKFPDDKLLKHISEEGFCNFIIKYLEIQN